MAEYSKAESIGKKLGRSSQFNTLLSKGLAMMQERKYKNALKEFIAADNIISNNKELVFYKSSAMILLFLSSSHKELNLPINQEYFNAVLKEYRSGIKTHKLDHFLYFYRGLVYLYMKDFDKAISDFGKAIKNNDVASYKYHMYLGLAYGCANLLNDAMKQLSTAIKLKDDYINAYYNRGKCAYLLGDIDQAFADFQKLLIIKPVTFIKILE